MKQVLAFLAALALGWSGATAYAQAVGGPQRHGAAAPIQQTRTMSTPKPGPSSGAGKVGGPTSNAGSLAPAPANSGGNTSSNTK